MLTRNAPWFAFGATAIAFLLAVALWFLPTSRDADDAAERASIDEPQAIVLCAPALRPALDPAAAEFQAKYGLRIELRYGASELLLTKLAISKQGDLFIPADDSYVVAARDKGLVDAGYELATINAVAAVRADRPNAATFAWNDLFEPGFRLVQPNPEITAIGKLSRQELLKTGLWARIEAARPASVGTVTEAANAVAIGSADGAIIWDAVAKTHPGLLGINLPELEKIEANVTAALCTNGVAKTTARWFAEYLADPNLGRKHLEAASYQPPRRVSGPGNGLVIYAGAMLRPAIEETIAEFERKEHVRVTRVYNGCGILVAQMRAGRSPDVYFACDPRFMTDVADLFDQPQVVSSNQLVIAVPKGNPNGIKDLKDLGKPDLRVGVGHEQQCALGAITKETFIQSGVYADVRRNVRVESPTGDLLVNQILTGSLDAVVCYVSNLSPNQEKLDAISLVGIPCSSPEQPVAIAKDSANTELAAKLLQALKGRSSRERFERLGFGWGSRELKK